jgi:threonine dehydratase
VSAVIPAIPAAEEIARARAFLQEHIPFTRLLQAPSLTQRLGAPVYLKLESELPTGSFKLRGALYALASQIRENTVAEVVTSSTGNHGAAVAYAARAFGIPATIFLPAGANPAKRARIAALGARIVEDGVDISAAAEAATRYVHDTGAFYLDDVTNAYVPAATATIASEIAEQAPDARVMIVPMGDTALIRGMAAVARSRNPALRVTGVQAATAPAYTLSWKKGEPVVTESCDTIADGLATRIPIAPNVAAIRQLVDDIVLVSDTEMLSTMRHLLLNEHVIAEPAGAASTAAALQLGRLQEPTVLVVTGSNLSAAMLARLADQRDLS